jgi:hypothetical protein
LAKIRYSALPNKKVLSVKICADSLKALNRNPNNNDERKRGEFYASFKLLELVPAMIQSDLIVDKKRVR